MVGVRFLSEGGSFLNVLVNEMGLKEIFTSWADPSLGIVLTGTNPDGTIWAVRKQGLFAVHTFDPSQLQQQPSYQPPSFMRKSG